MKAINFSAAVENIPKQWSKVDLRSWYILNIVLLLDCTPSVIAMNSSQGAYLLVKALSTGST
jgi:hypothetical protein